MSKPSARVDRRAADRPSVGECRSCPRCATGMLEFTERYRSSTSPSAATAPMPGWVCDQCPYVVFVRAAHQPATARRIPEDVRAHANRKLMKARFVRGRAERALQKSLDRRHRR